MTVLGITGPTGAGKTTLLREVENLGGGVIDCDEVYHQLLESDSTLQKALEKEFGPLREGAGPIDRKRLGAIVFGDAGKLEVLNAIAWRAVVEHTQELIQAHQAQGKVLAAVDAIALLECPLRELCQLTVAVLAPPEVRVKRIMARDHITEQYARLPVNAQKQDEYYRGKCDCELNNATESPEEFRRDAYLFFERLVETIQEEKRHG